MAIKVTGLKQLKSNLSKSIGAMETEVTEKGITAGLILLSGYSTLVTPVDTANLVNSQYITIPKKTGTRVEGAIGYTAAYAAAVHDGGEKNWQKTGAQAEYLTGPADENQSEIWRTIKENSKI